MPVMLPNVFLSTQRSSYSATTGQTGAATTYLSNVPAHVEPTPQNSYHPLPPAALNSQYMFMVDTGTDIAPGDYLSSIVLYTDGVTVWPGMGRQLNADEVWRVVFVEEQAPVFLPALAVYVARETLGGTPYA